MQQMINQMMTQNFFHDGFGKFDNINYPKLNMEELKDKYILKFELAGMDKKNIKLSLKDTILVLEGERKSSKEDKSKDYVKQEMFYGKFKRVVQLPDNIIVNKMENKFENGILTLSIPKKKVSEPKYRILKIN